VFFSVICFFGCVTTLDVALAFSDIANALMAIPNLISLIALHNVVAKECFTYQEEVVKLENLQAKE
jgi:AGCS family alanine or glycine:cation symporter